MKHHSGSLFSAHPVKLRRCPVCKRERGVIGGKLVPHYGADFSTACSGSGRKVGIVGFRDDRK